MNHVPRPLLGLLAATVVFFALWIVALKPSSSSPSASSGVGQFQPAINAAKAAVATSNHSNAAAAGNTATPAAATPAATTPAATTPAATARAATKPAAARHHAAPRAHHAARTHAKASHRVATPTDRVALVNAALAKHRVLALLFYNPAASDDRAVKQELKAIPTRHGRVVKLAIPLSELASYPVITNQVLIQTSPTLAIIDHSAQAFTLVGFVDGLEIAQRLDNALSTH
ncbi:MAG TPA: hypothetical protein VG294_03565 [Solirubrobacteraceae bacterium]|nr:hypothetical protein [Solirubrobacteraceae bacterium]